MFSSEQNTGATECHTDACMTAENQDMETHLQPIQQAVQQLVRIMLLTLLELGGMSAHRG